jgi:hypothetical protein
MRGFGDEGGASKAPAYLSWLFDISRSIATRH